MNIQDIRFGTYAWHLAHGLCRPERVRIDRPTPGGAGKFFDVIPDATAFKSVRLDTLFATTEEVLAVAKQVAISARDHKAAALKAAQDDVQWLEDHFAHMMLADLGAAISAVGMPSPSDSTEDLSHDPGDPVGRKYGVVGQHDDEFRPGSLEPVGVEVRGPAFHADAGAV